MGAIQNYSFSDFINAIKNQVGSESAEKVELNTSKFKSIFDIAARTDGGENVEILEEDYQGFKDLVDKTIVAFNNMFEKGKDALKQMEFIPGNSKTKENGALTPDTVKEYENGELVRIVTGFDEDGDGQLTGNEIDTDLTAGNWRTKQNGALTPDVVKEYENGELERIVTGFDENENGWIEDDEIENVENTSNINKSVSVGGVKTTNSKPRTVNNKSVSVGGVKTTNSKPRTVNESKILKQGYRKTLCKGVYYHEATNTHYRDVNGQLQKIMPRTKKPDHIVFATDGSRSEYTTSRNGERIETVVGKNNKILRKCYYKDNKNGIGRTLLRTELFDENEKLKDTKKA